LCLPTRQGGPHGQTESGGSRVLAVNCWSPSAQGRCHPTGRCAYLTTFSHFMIVNKTSLSLSLSLSLCLSLSLSVSLSLLARPRARARALSLLALSLRAHPLLTHSQMLAHLGGPVEGALLLVRRPHLEREVEEWREGKRESIRNTIQVCRTYTIQVCVCVCVCW
jgi:hypothetical protein